MAVFTLVPMPVPEDCHVVGGKSKAARTRVHYSDEVLIRGRDGRPIGDEGRTLCGQVGALTDVGSATGVQCQRCVAAKDSAARVKRLAR